MLVNIGIGGSRTKSIPADVIVREIGITPIGDRQEPDHDGDRYADFREIAGGGKLAAVLQEAQRETGRNIEDLMVMAGTDPFRLDTLAKHRAAQWFADQVARFIGPDQNIHPRGVFYACVSAGDVRLPNGDLFENTADNAIFIGRASQFARWLGYVPFERLIDNKNDAPIVIPIVPHVDPSAQVLVYDLAIEDLDPDDLDVAAGLAGFTPRQPYRLVIFGEKASLEDVLGPLAQEYGADLYLMGGQISDTYLHQMARDADADGRPFVVFTFSDFDPAGYWDMPAAIGRKMQALRVLKFPMLEFTVVHAALGPEQVRDLDLPDSPLKEGENRAVAWKELYGSEQTEIDALATLRPDTLEDIARAAIAPYFDAGLRRRVSLAEIEWRRAARAEIAGQLDHEGLDALKARARAALDVMREVNAELEEMADEVGTFAPPDLPGPDLAALEEAQDEARGAVLIDSGMTYVEATDRLRAHGEREARRPVRGG